MGEKTDRAKGRAEEAVGSLTGDKHLKRAGRSDRLAGETKAKLGHAENTVGAVVDKVKDAVPRK
jgi:uncharacterized protein YjbJ (UPF0337 family)